MNNTFSKKHKKIKKSRTKKSARFRPKKSKKTRKNLLGAGDPIETGRAYSPYEETKIREHLTEQTENRDQHLANMLRLACPNSDNCIALGVYGDAIKQLFKDFKALKMVDIASIKQIGSPSSNGFVLQLPFKNQGYIAYTVLKCSIASNADNLYYEYYVGKHFINNFLKKYPCFVETYDCYHFKTEDQLYIAQDFPTRLNVTSLEKIVGTNDEILWQNSCKLNKNLCYLSQHFDKVLFFKDLIKEKAKYGPKFDNYIINTLYQVYYVLCALNRQYTHYDLHDRNVLLYKPFEGKKYIEMHYHTGGNEFVFQTEHIAKIIDYGRNFFDNEITNTEEILENYICKDRWCHPSCGMNQGYKLIRGDVLTPGVPKTKDDMFITPNRPNMSHDLRFMKRLEGYALASELPQFNLVYKGAGGYGTPENLNPGGRAGWGSNYVINSIFDARDFLEENIGKAYSFDSTWEKTAIMHIYDDDRDYTFELVHDIQYPVTNERRKTVYTGPLDFVSGFF